MTISVSRRGDRRTRGSQLCRTLHARSNDALHSRRRRPDEGGLLIEVLVGMFILVLVFTATSITLSSMADIRTKVEQRDRALAIASSYEELSRTFGCGFLTDRIADSLSSNPAVPNQGKTDFENKVKSCDFAADRHNKENPTLPPQTPVNAGDQDFKKREQINETGSIQTFTIKIRYWWEDSVKQTHSGTCAAITTVHGTAGYLPVVMARAITVSWEEKNTTRRVSIIKRDPIPVDNVVFASGSRANLLVARSGAAAVNNQWVVRMYPYGTGSYIERRIDNVINPTDPTDNQNRFTGQPAQCVWFSYVTPSPSDARQATSSENGSAFSSLTGEEILNVSGPTGTGAQRFKVVSS